MSRILKYRIRVPSIVCLLLAWGLMNASASDKPAFMAEYKMTSGWTCIPILCKNGTKVDNVPKKAGFWIKAGPSKAKIYILLKDKRLSPWIYQNEEPECSISDQSAKSELKLL